MIPAAGIQALWMAAILAHGYRHGKDAGVGRGAVWVAAIAKAVDELSDGTILIGLNEGEIMVGQREKKGPKIILAH